MSGVCHFFDFGEDKQFCVEIASKSRAVCKKCKLKCVQGELRIAKIVYVPEASRQKLWYHVKCLFEVFDKQRVTTRRIESPRDIEGWECLSQTDQEDLFQRIKECNRTFEMKSIMKAAAATARKAKGTRRRPPNVSIGITNEDSLSIVSECEGPHRDNMFRVFRVVVADVSHAATPAEKTAIIQQMFQLGSDRQGFKSDINLWVRLLLPGVQKRVFNLQARQLTKIFGKILHVPQEVMMRHLEQGRGDLGHTIQHFFQESRTVKPVEKTLLTVQEVDVFLDKLANISREDEQLTHFKSVLKRCTGNDLKVIIRLIMHDLRMNASPKVILDAIHESAYQLFHSCRDITALVNACWEGGSERGRGSTSTITAPLSSPHSSVPDSPIPFSYHSTTLQPLSTISGNPHTSTSLNPLPSTSIIPSSIHPSTSVFPCTSILPNLSITNITSSSPPPGPSKQSASRRRKSKSSESGSPTISDMSTVTKRGSKSSSKRKLSLTDRNLSLAEPLSVVTDHPSPPSFVPLESVEATEPISRPPKRRRVLEGTKIPEEPVTGPEYTIKDISNDAPTRGKTALRHQEGRITASSPSSETTTITDSNANESVQEKEFRPESTVTREDPCTSSKTTDVYNMFEGMKVVLEDGIAKRHGPLIKRFVDLGAVIVPSNSKEITHVFHMRDTVKELELDSVKSAKHIMIEWIVDSVKKLEVQDWRPYTVRWDPELEIEEGD